MKNLIKLSLADLISGLNYLEDFATAIESALQRDRNIFEKDSMDELVKRLSSINHKKLLFRKELLKSLFNKSEVAIQEKSVDRKKIENDVHIENYINKAIKLNDIPKGNKNKTLYRKLRNVVFLISLSEKIMTKMKSKYNYSIEKRELLEILYDDTLEKLKRVKRNQEKPKKQLKTIEYEDGIEYK